MRFWFLVLLDSRLAVSYHFSIFICTIVTFFVRLYYKHKCTLSVESRYFLFETAPSKNLLTMASRDSALNLMYLPGLLVKAPSPQRSKKER